MTSLSMKYRSQKSGRIVTCVKDAGSGGEGKVYVTNSNGLVAKIYHPNHRPDPKVISKLTYMIENPPDQLNPHSSQKAIIWPLDLLEKDGRVVGFLMDYINGKPLADVISPQERKKSFPGHTWRHAVVVAYNLAWIMTNIHAKNYVIGDVNTQNIKVMPDGLVAIIDTDSFQVFDQQRGEVYPCGVLSEEFSAHDVSKQVMDSGQRESHQDCFSLAVIIFKLFYCGQHPFSGIYKLPGEQPSNREAILAGQNLFDNRPTFKLPTRYPDLSFLPPELHSLFRRCFVDGRKNPRRRPAASEWKKAVKTLLEPGRLKDCAITKLHVYPSHLSACPWCELQHQRKVEYFDPNYRSSATQRLGPKAYTGGQTAPAMQPKPLVLFKPLLGAVPGPSPAPLQPQPGPSQQMAPLVAVNPQSGSTQTNQQGLLVAGGSGLKWLSVLTGDTVQSFARIVVAAAAALLFISINLTLK